MHGRRVTRSPDERQPQAKLIVCGTWLARSPGTLPNPRQTRVKHPCFVADFSRYCRLYHTYSEQQERARRELLPCIDNTSTDRFENNPNGRVPRSDESKSFAFHSVRRRVLRLLRQKTYNSATFQVFLFFTYTDNHTYPFHPYTILFSRKLASNKETLHTFYLFTFVSTFHIQIYYYD